MNCPYAITPSDTRGEQPRIATAPVAVNPDRDLALLDALPPGERLQLLGDVLRRMAAAMKDEAAA